MGSEGNSGEAWLWVSAFPNGQRELGDVRHCNQRENWTKQPVI